MKNVPFPIPGKIASELKLGTEWDSARIHELIARKTGAGRIPAFLFLGEHEAVLLRQHLGSAFGPEAVRCLKNVYYMGLEVIELDTPSFFRTAGMKRVQDFRKRIGRKPGWQDVSDGSLWQHES